MANSLLDFVMSLVRDPDAAAQYAANPAQTIADANLTDSAREAARSYAESFRQAQDTLGTFVHETAGALGSLKSWLDGTFRRGE